MDKCAVPTEIIRFALFCPPIRQRVQRGVLNFCILKPLALQSISRIFCKKMQSSIPEISLYRAKSLFKHPYLNKFILPLSPLANHHYVFTCPRLVSCISSKGDVQTGILLYIKKIQGANSPTFKIFSPKPLARQRISSFKSSGPYF